MKAIKRYGLKKIFVIVIKKVLNIILYAIITLISPFLAPIISFMAKTGAGTNFCLMLKCLPLPVHFYSPIPDIKDLEQRNIWEKVSLLEGINFNKEYQLKLLNELGGKYGHECKWPLNKTEDPYQFYLENGNFSFGCAASLHCIIRNYRPSRIIEVGSGNSSLVISNAVLENSKEGNECEYIIVDPYPRYVIEEGIPCGANLIKERVELLHKGIFDSLKENDILIIDSGHTVRIGGDVNFLILDVLPRLSKGTIIHFHDINLPYEYPKVYATNPKFREFWTEAYLLQAFLSCNDKFEIMLTMSYLMLEHKKIFKKLFPYYNDKEHNAISGSFWIRKNK